MAANNDVGSCLLPLPIAGEEPPFWVRYTVPVALLALIALAFFGHYLSTL